MVQRLLFLTCFFMFLPGALPGQADSLNQEAVLLQELEVATSDTARIRLYAMLGAKIRRKDAVAAHHYLNQALKLLEKTNVPPTYYRTQKSMIVNGLGVVAKKFGNYAAAIDHYFESLTLAEQMEDRLAESTALFNLGALYKTLKEYDQALAYHRKSLAIRLELNGYPGITNCYNAIGILQRKLGQNDSAIYYYQQSLAISEAQLDSVTDPQARAQYLIATATSNTGIGVVANLQGDYRKAIGYYRKSLQINETVQNISGIIKSKRNIAGCYRQLGQERAAEKFLLDALGLAQKDSLLAEQAALTLSLSNLFKEKARFQAAFQYLQKHLRIRNRLNNENQTKALARRETEFRFEKILAADSVRHLEAQKVKDAEIFAQNETIRRKEAEARQDRIIQFGLFGGMAIALGFLLFILNQKKVIAREKQRSEDLLHNILPEETAEELKLTGLSKPKPYQKVTVLFTDFKGFTMLSEQLTAEELVNEIDYCFRGFDAIIGKYRIEKIKTIGDAYMAVAGLPEEYEENPVEAVRAALEIRDFMTDYQAKRAREGRIAFEIRIGLHTGPVVAGIVGSRKFAYDIWGDTVNTAARMESSGTPGKVNVSGTTFQLLQGEFASEFRGKVEAKNKGKIEMYYVEHKASPV